METLQMIHAPVETRRWLWPLLTLALVVAVLAVFSFNQSPTRNVAGQETTASALPVTVATPLAEHAGPPAPVLEDSAGAADLADREQQARIDQSRQDLVRLYRSEKTDPAWAAAKERELLPLTQVTQIQQMNAVPKQLDIDCKTSSCRVQADFDSSGAANDWATVFTASLGTSMPTGTVQQVTNPDGSVTIEVYGAMH
jgi:hypothetical protein